LLNPTSRELNNASSVSEVISMKGEIYDYRKYGRMWKKIFMAYFSTVLPFTTNSDSGK
jgi:hypothetical protein